MSWTPSSQYTFGSTPRPTRGVSTSPTEVAHVTIAFLVLTFDLMVVGGALTPGDFGTVQLATLLPFLVFGLVAAASGFVAHEMAHKITAERYGFWAEFRLSASGLLLSVVTALFGFIFAAPGATVVGGMGDAREWGRTSLAGPLVNLVEATAFLGAGGAVASLTHSSSYWPFFLLLAFINAWFATFNLVPLGPLDGRKVYRWDPRVWVVSIAASASFAGAMLYLTSVHPPPF
ncbi:MAG: metalloprotease [Thermoplasmata archaeon]|nr:metalloprotease [Thermoplasmata archaeon]